MLKPYYSLSKDELAKLCRDKSEKILRLTEEKKDLELEIRLMKSKLRGAGHGLTY